ncbi:MAG: thioredoxin family protein [Deltaproteobacteria bacterium]|nr:thioredoxin family protein [Deltaproteobacteria bacterium]
MEIKVLGPGCNQCDQLEQDLMSVLSEFNIPGNVDHVRDIKEIGTYGVMGMPALIINGKVKSVGKVPPRSKLIEWLKGTKGK